MTSENGDLLKQLVSDINNRYQGEIPKAYIRFLKNISRATSVTGWLQYTGPEALQYLREFTNNTLDVKHRNNKVKLIFLDLTKEKFYVNVDVKKYLLNIQTFKL